MFFLQNKTFLKFIKTSDIAIQFCVIISNMEKRKQNLGAQDSVHNIKAT